MGEPTEALLAPEVVQRRLESVWAAAPSAEQWQALWAYTGRLPEGEPAGYLKSYALLTYLLGVDAQEMAVAIVWPARTLYVCTAQAVWAEALNRLTEALPEPSEMQLRVVQLEAAEEVAQALAARGVPRTAHRWATLLKERTQHDGAFAAACAAFVYGADEVSTDLDNAAEWVGNLLIRKHDDEVAIMRQSAHLASRVCQVFFVDRMETAFDEDTHVTHEKLSEEVEACLAVPHRVGLKLPPAECEAAFPPIIQSGADGPFDLRPSAASDQRRLRTGVVLASIGARYRQYCSNVVRTYLVDADRSVRQMYAALLQALEAVRRALVPGRPASDAYQAATEALGAEVAAQHLALRYVGYGIGLEFRDSTWLLNEKNHKRLQPGMSFVIGIGLHKVGANGKAALMLADTVLVNDSAEGAEVLTTTAAKVPSKVTYFLEAEEEEVNEDGTGRAPEEHADGAKENRRMRADADEVNGGAGRPEKPNMLSEPAMSSVGARRRGQAASATEADAEAVAAEAERIRAHQAQLATEKLAESRARALGDRTVGKGASDDGGRGADGDGRPRTLDQYIAYPSADAYPAALRPRQLHVDMEREVLLVPINGVPVPFHVATIKNASKSEESGFAYLRINFHVPGAGSSGVGGGGGTTGGAVAAAQSSLFPPGTKAVLKELSFRSQQASNLNEVLRKIKELRKRFTSREAEAHVKETLVKQAPLSLETDARRIPHLVDVCVRPPIGSGGQKANHGVLEAHLNGMRFRSRQQRTVDILYANVKHAFFQEAKNEVVVVVHFHLHTPIMVGKRKTADVQFYTEVMDSTVRLADSRRNPYDVDELEEEQRERENRNRLNKLFFKFTKEVEAKSNETIEFDMPYRELGFEGAPDKSQRFLMPTRDCLVDLIESPPFIVTLEDVEVAHLERVTYSLKNFDLVLVMKNFSREPTARNQVQWVRISSIPTSEMDSVKKWLDSVNIPFYQGPSNLNWNVVLRTIREDLEGFYEEGGWRFLDAEASSEEEEGEGEEGGDGDGDEDEEFMLDDSELEDADASTSDDDDDDDGDEDYDDELDVEEELGDDDAGEEELDSDDEGLDWDEMERRTRAEEKRHKRPWEDEDDDADDDEEAGRGRRDRKHRSRARG
ncbi:hypothetical protein CDCA_CDCA06G1854 [Cyanidium caldarium]|uniref:FACT complex subunit n=1 Tax=Cyanidium caldarium TaxID=2771 RepID=A0AAV9IU89_CYACA|nr:hypothetical protein CDCA_CDCA06G1854 [Cyanidium caldarium]